MTTFVKTNEPFAHSDMKSLRLVLKSWAGGWSTLKNLVETPLYEGDEKDVLAILHEAMEAGLLEVSEEGVVDLTHSGRAIASSKAGRRFSKKEAYTILEGIKENVILLNGDDRSPIWIEKIWVFGSLLDDAVDEIGDIDIAFETKYREWVVPRSELYNYVHRTYPGLVTTAFWQSYMIGSHFIDRKVFGRRRPPRVSLIDFRSLLTLGCPCAVYFQHGEIQEGVGPTLPRHPDAERVVVKRDNSIRLNGIDSGGTRTPTSSAILAEVTSFECDSTQLRIISQPIERDLQENPLLGPIGSIDGTSVFAIGFDNRSLRRPYLMLVRRHVSFGSEKLTLTVGISLLFDGERRLSPEPHELIAAGRLLEIILGADVRRFRFQARREGQRFSLVLNFDYAGDVKVPYQKWLDAVEAAATAEHSPVKDREYNPRRVRYDDYPLLPSNSRWRHFKF